MLHSEINQSEKGFALFPIVFHSRDTDGLWTERYAFSESFQVETFEDAFEEAERLLQENLEKMQPGEEWNVFIQYFNGEEERGGEEVWEMEVSLRESSITPGKFFSAIKRSA